jgi:Uma2 family endonuclease
MVIEIVSESDPGLDYREKLPRYRRAGIEEIWIVNPFENQVLVEVKTDAEYAARTFSIGRLESAVVPGFWIEVEWLWRENPPSTFKCVWEMLS